MKHAVLFRVRSKSDTRRKSMDPITLIAMLSGAVASSLALQKFKELVNFLSRKEKYDKALGLHEKLIKIISKDDHSKVKSETIKRIIIDDKDIDNENFIKNAYSEIYEKIKEKEFNDIDIEVSDYRYVKKFMIQIKAGESGRFATAVNSGLIDSLLKNFVSSTDRSAINRSTIVGMLVGKRMKSDAKSYAYLISALVIYTVSSVFGLGSFSAYFYFFIFTMLSGLMVNQKVLEYRITKGLYGSNSYEAREIIRYIEEHTDPDDFYDGDDRKRIFQEAVEDAPREEIVYGGAYR